MQIYYDPDLENNLQIIFNKFWVLLEMHFRHGKVEFEGVIFAFAVVLDFLAFLIVAGISKMVLTTMDSKVT